MVAILSFLLLLLSALFCSNFSSGLGTGGMQDTPLRLHVKEDEFLPRFEAIYPPEEEEPQNRELRHAIIQNRMQKEGGYTGHLLSMMITLLIVMIMNAPFGLFGCNGLKLVDSVVHNDVESSRVRCRTFALKNQNIKFACVMSDK
jgi:hypothetical protein